MAAESFDDEGPRGAGPGRFRTLRMIFFLPQLGEMLDRSYCLLEDLATQIEKFIDHCTQAKLAAPHAADVKRMAQHGLKVNGPNPTTAAAAAVVAAQAVAHAIPDPEKPLQPPPAEEGDGRRKKKRRHHGDDISSQESQGHHHHLLNDGENV